MTLLCVFGSVFLPSAAAVPQRWTHLESFEPRGGDAILGRRLVAQLPPIRLQTRHPLDSLDKRENARAHCNVLEDKLDRIHCSYALTPAVSVHAQHARSTKPMGIIMQPTTTPKPRDSYEVCETPCVRVNNKPSPTPPIMHYAEVCNQQ